MNDQPTTDNSIDPTPVRSGIYSPVDPLPYEDDLDDDIYSDEDLTTDDDLGNPAEDPEMPVYDGDLIEHTPRHPEADRQFEYDQNDADADVNR